MSNDIQHKRGQLENASVASFLMAGMATLTVVNTRTNGRFTFRINLPKKTNKGGYKQVDRKANCLFVSVLTGADNETDYSFIGTIFLTPTLTFRYSRKSRISQNAVSVKAFTWFFNHINALPDCIEVYHEGYCGRCGKQLTVPESIVSGFGPECIRQI